MTCKRQKKISYSYNLFAMLLLFSLPTVVWASPTLIYPSGGETFQAGSDCINIQWASEPAGTARIEVQYVWQGSNHYVAWLADDLPSGTTNYNWCIPSDIYGRIASGAWGTYPTETTEGRIKVNFYDSGDSFLGACNNGVFFTVNPPPCDPVVITQNPQSQTVCEGDSVSVSVSATGTGPLSYQWRKNGSNIPGATSSGYTVNPVSSGDAGNYDCVVSNSCPSSATSSAATLAVNTAPTITQHPQSQSACEGDSVTFNVSATGTAPLSYQWRKNSVNIGGATSSSYTINPVSSGDAGNYDCVVSNSCGSVTSNPATLTVSILPIITQDPVQSPDPVVVGDDVTFTIVAPGATSYQWYEGITPVGSSNPSYQKNNVQLSDDGIQITCDVTNSCGTVTSNPTTLNVDTINCCSLNPHPADSDDDCRIVISEAVAYATCWKTGCIWPVGPDPVEIGHAVNGGLLWKTGECYCYDELLLPEPGCWISAACAASSSALDAGSAGPLAWDFDPSIYTPESPVEVLIDVTPDPGTMVHAVEDAPPVGWTVSNINESGAWDSVNEKVKWGLFFDASVRTLTYDITPPAGETGEKTFSGTASFDGVDETFVRTIPDVCPLEGQGDFDDDCDVDEDDLRILIGNWLVGVQ